MKKLIYLLTILVSTTIGAQDIQQLENWKFTQYNYDNAPAVNFSDVHWQLVTVPHDWAVKEDFDLCAKKDFTDMYLRDRNQPSIIIWSIGNEVMEQYQTNGAEICIYLNEIVKSIDTTRV